METATTDSDTDSEPPAEDEDYVCEECREPIQKDASRCPNCEYNPERSHKRWGIFHSVLSIFLFLSVVGIPIGIFTLWRSIKHERAQKEASPAVPA